MRTEGRKCVQICQDAVDSASEYELRTGTRTQRIFGLTSVMVHKGAKASELFAKICIA